MTAYGLDDVPETNFTSLILAAAGGKEKHLYINEESEELSIKVGTNSLVATLPSWFTLTHLRIAGNPRWGNRPGNG
jgi:hypothetical protein